MKRTFLFTLVTLAFGLLIAACSSQTASNLSPTAAPPNTSASNNANASTCAMENHAPLDAFRPDSVSKLTASTKPKLIEFYAVW